MRRNVLKWGLRAGGAFLVFAIGFVVAVALDEEDPRHGQMDWGK